MILFKKKLNLLILVLSLLLLCLSLFALDNARPEKWAKPLNSPGLHNLYQVSEHLYRGSKPDLKGFGELKKLGVKTVVNLEVFHSDRKKIKQSKTGLAYEHLFVNVFKMSDAQIVRFLKIVTDKNKTPVFVHCYHGSDRTGTFVAAYRIVVQGWTKEAAIDEFVNGGYGYHKIFSNLIDYLNSMDIDKIKKQVSESTH